MAEDYWVSYLQEAAPLHFPVLGERTQPGRSMVEVPVAKEVMEKIRQAAGQKELNVLKLFMGALGIVLSRYTAQKDITIAMPPMQLPGVNIEGCGSLYCRLSVEEELPVSTYFARLHEAVNNAYLNSEYNEALFRDVYEQSSKNSPLSLQGVAFRYTGLHAEGAWLQRHKLIFVLSENEGPCIRVITEQDHWPEQLLINMANSLLHVVLHFPVTRDGILKDCNILPANELAAWQNRFDKNNRPYPTNTTVVDRFLQQVATNPGKTAVINGHTSLTYAQLDELSGRISQYIASMPAGASPRIIGVMMDRTYLLAATIIGILRTGAAYVPIDKAYPEERVRDVLHDTGCRLVLTSSQDFVLKEEGCVWTAVDTLPPVTAPTALIPPSPADLAYVLYSSGTTGKPKGIMMEHGAIMNLLYWYDEHYSINENTRIVQLTNIVIDIAFQEMFSAFINGLTLFIPLPEESRDRQRFIDYLNRHQINFIQLIPDLLSEYLSGQPKLPWLEQVLCGGDKLSDSLKDEIAAKGYQLYNIYGQTETAIDTVGATCREGVPMEFNEFVPHYEMYIVDAQGRLCPEYIPGEIITGGPGLARGYLNQPALTGAKFVAHPFKKDKKVYRTGDMARRLPGGGIELLGREDDQVKILGFRIEPVEIERALEACPGIEKVVVVAYENGKEKQLVAYYTCDAMTDATQLRPFLVKSLPLYMIPHYFIRLDKFPLTPAGKIDRKALPAPTIEKAKNYVAPAGPLEEKLVDIWAEVLKLEPAVIGIHSNFFELGGHSLKVVRVITAIEKEFNVRIQLTTFFTRPTIAELEECILMDALSKQVTPTAKKITI